MAFDIKTAKPVDSSPMSATDVAKSAVKNFPRSFSNVVGGLVEAISSPIQTGKAALDVLAGGLQNILPESIVKAIGEDPASRKVASQVADMYVRRYGGIEQAKQTIATDPAGFMADVASLLTVGSGAAPQLGKVASFVDPISLGVKGASAVGGRALPALSGMQTGVGSEPIKEAYRAGREGGEKSKMFRENITGRAPITDILDSAKQSLDAMNQAKQQQYRSGMVNIKNDKTVLSFDGIDSAISNAQKKTSYKGKVVNERAAQELDNVRQIIDDWKAQNPAEFHTPEGLDALKQRIGDVLEGIPYEQKQARAAVGDIYSSIRSEITRQAPAYSKVMKDYAEASDLIKEIERSLSLGKKSSADTALRKLQSIMRNNVNTNYGQRAELLKALESFGSEISPAIAGQTLGQYSPRGIQGATSVPAAFAAFSAGGLPLAIPSLLAASPRVAGEAAYASGLAARGASKARDIVPLAFDPRTYNLMYQAGQIKDK